MKLWEYLDAQAKRRERRRDQLLDKGLDARSLFRLWLQSIDAKFFIALVVISLFAWAYGENTDDDTMKGALIAAFAGAWGYYLGSSRGASAANDRSDSSLELAREAMSKLPDKAEADVTLRPGETTQAAPARPREEG